MHAKLDMACNESDYHFDLGLAPASHQVKYKEHGRLICGSSKDFITSACFCLLRPASLASCLFLLVQLQLGQTIPLTVRYQQRLLRPE
jgi:hypothetical protein